LVLLFAHAVFATSHASNLDSSEPAFKPNAGKAAHSNPDKSGAASGVNSKPAESDARTKNQIGTVVQPGATGVSYTASLDRGWFDIELSGLPALPSAKFLSYAPAVVIQSGALLSPASTFTQTRRITAYAGEPGVALKRRFVANLRSTSSPQFLLEVLDFNGVALCSATGSATQVANCDIEVTLSGDQASPPDRNSFVVRATNKGGGSSQFELESYVLNLQEASGVFNGPGSVAAGDTFRVRAAHNFLRIVPPTFYMATFLRIYSATGQLVKEIPVRFRWDGTDYSAMPLLGFYDPANKDWSKRYSASFSQRSIHGGLFVDIPVNATSVTFGAVSGEYDELPPQDPTRDIDLYLVPAANPATDPSQSRIAKVSTAAAAFQATALNSSLAPSEAITVTGSDLTPGRWYVVPVSKSGQPMNMTATAVFNNFSAPPDFQSGHYFNPSRSGHGAFLDFAGDQWVMVWYTYLQDGTPTWYYAAGPAPTDAVGRTIWQSTLNRVVWDGNQTFAYAAGTGIVTVLGDNSFQFSYILDGEAGSEKMVRLGGPGCVAYNGNSLDATGHWFSPSKSGFGYSAQFEPGTEVHVAYMYDAKGQPRWLYGQKSYNPAIGTLNMLQLRGFCPLCTAVSPTNTHVGTLVRTLGAAAVPDNLPGLTSMSLNATLAPPLSGTWSENRPVGMLSARKNCR
jgi:hypothetical protein